MSRRLGNIAEISALREELIRLYGPQNFIAERVLFSGTHSGDMIPLDSLPALEAEIDSICTASRPSAGFRRFLDSLRELIQASREQENPIVFA